MAKTTEPKPKERKAPVRNPRYELARLQIVRENISKRCALLKARYESAIKDAEADALKNEMEISALEKQIESTKQPEFLEQEKEALG